MKPSGYDKGRPYWIVAGIMFFDRERAERAEQEVVQYYRTERYTGD